MTFARYLMGVKRRTRILVIARLVGYLKAYVDDASKISAIYLKKKIVLVHKPSFFALGICRYAHTHLMDVIW